MSDIEFIDWILNSDLLLNKEGLTMIEPADADNKEQCDQLPSCHRLCGGGLRRDDPCDRNDHTGRDRTPAEGRQTGKTGKQIHKEVKIKNRLSEAVLFCSLLDYFIHVRRSFFSGGVDDVRYADGNRRVAEFDVNGVADVHL